MDMNRSWSGSVIVVVGWGGRGVACSIGSIGNWLNALECRFLEESLPVALSTRNPRPPMQRQVFHQSRYHGRI